MTRYLVQMKPKNLDNIIAMVALYRPGPMEFIPDYIARMHGEAEVEYRHPALEPIFKDTYGIPVYQEQLMRAAVRTGGLHALRVGRTAQGDLQEEKEKTRETPRQVRQRRGRKRHGPRHRRRDLHAIGKSSPATASTRAHAADYGVIAVQTAYLKVALPRRIYDRAALGLAGRDRKGGLLCRRLRARMGMPVLPPDINASDWDFAIEDCSDEQTLHPLWLGRGQERRRRRRWN